MYTEIQDIVTDLFYLKFMFLQYFMHGGKKVKKFITF